MLLLTDRGLAIARFTPDLQRVFGQAPDEEGHQLIEMAALHGRSQVTLRDWLYCLAQWSESLVRRQLIDARGKGPQAFLRAVESRYDSPVLTDLPVPRLLPSGVDLATATMLDRVGQKLVETEMVTEPLLVQTILETADDDLAEMLQLWAGESGIARFKRRLRREMSSEQDDLPPLFLGDGRLNFGRFDPSGLRTIRRIGDDASSMSTERITTRHVLYSLLSAESSSLALGLSVQGIDVKRTLLGVLVREICRAASGTRTNFVWSRASCFLPVVQWLERAARLAQEREVSLLTEGDLELAFAESESREIQRLLSSSQAYHRESLLEYVRSSATTSQKPASNAFANRAESIQAVERGIRSRLFGQETAISRILPWIKRLRFGVPRDGRPAGVFLFVGPTGTGKTQLARELARFVYGDERRLLFLEMGQFKTPESVSMLIGAPPGYVGYGDGKLTNGLGEQPECIVLFDEIEKAHRQVFDVILRFADEGMISDPAGPVRDGRRCIIVLTTNAGQAWLRKHGAEIPRDVDHSERLSQQLFAAALRELARRGFRQEFLARIDERLAFLPFSEEACLRIVAANLDREYETFRNLKQVVIQPSEAVNRLLVKLGGPRLFDEGARAFPRLINQLLIAPLIDRLTEDARTGSVPLNVTWRISDGQITPEVSA